MRTVAEIIAELLEHTDQAAVTSALANESHNTIKNFRSSQFAAGKTEGGKPFKTFTDALKGANSLDTLLGVVATAGFTDEQAGAIKTATPDRTKLEGEIKMQYETKLNELRTKVTKLTGSLQTGAKDRAIGQFAGFLSASGTDLEALGKKFKGLELGGVLGDYAGEVLTARFKDRLVVDEEGNVTDVLKPGEATGYEGTSIEHKLALLAADVRKTVPATLILAKGDKGSGIRGGDGGQPGSGASLTTVQDKKLATGDYRL
jgi:hypothetical protein